jgi:hypothetical protein
MKRAPRESDIYSELSKFMRLKYPTLIWRFDFSAGTKMSIGQARVHKGLNPHRGYPDLFICRPSNGYAGLFIEIKQQGVKVAKLDGSPLANEHLAEQAQIIDQLKREGYYATFACGLMECIEIIEKYLR